MVYVPDQLPKLGFMLLSAAPSWRKSVESPCGHPPPDKLSPKNCFNTFRILSSLMYDNVLVSGRFQIGNSFYRKFSEQVTLSFQDFRDSCSSKLITLFYIIVY